MPSKRDVLGMSDFRTDLMAVLELAGTIKKQAKAAESYAPLKGKSLAMIFEKASTRTRVSFEVGMTQLGGHALHLNPSDLQLGRGETIGDTARVLSRYVDGIVYRSHRHTNLVDLARNATVPVINALDDREHPCQVVGDLMTILEKRGQLGGLTLAYVGDGNNVCNSLVLGGAIAAMHVRVGCPNGYEPDGDLVNEARTIARETGGSVDIMESPQEAVLEADVLYTDVWVSMGMESEREAREAVFRPYQVNRDLVSRADGDAFVMHCLPAHRGLEITDEAMDGPHSIVFDQAENRLHAQKAILATLLA